jgi:mannose/fructose/N-acetylgalactosamine-specific phosphotransferase system component IIC
VTVTVSTIAVAVSTIAVAVSTICAVLVSTIIDAVDPSLENGDGIGVGTIAILGMEPRRT